MRWFIVAVTLMALTGCALLEPVTGEEDQVLLRVNCGAEEDYVDQTGALWVADGQLVEGPVAGLTVERVGLTMPGSDAPNVYLTERYSMEAYEFSLPDGTYTLRLHFAETYDGISGPDQRIFSVLVNGETALEDFDPFKAAGGFATPVVREVRDVEVTDGILRIEFEPNIQNPEINGIEIIGKPLTEQEKAGIVKGG